MVWNSASDASRAAAAWYFLRPAVSSASRRNTSARTVSGADAHASLAAAVNRFGGGSGVVGGRVEIIRVPSLQCRLALQTRKQRGINHEANGLEARSVQRFRGGPVLEYPLPVD